jgi:glycosyltransferase involved in cell wall biosynthesis
VVARVYRPAVLPFGSLSWIRDKTKARLLRKTAGVITISHFIEEYMQQWQPGLNSVVLPMPVFGQGPFPHLASFDEGHVVMLNPSAIKGLSIFLELARCMPDVSFAAVPSWATQPEDCAALQQLHNVRLLPPSDNMEGILAQTRVLLMPSLWAEGFTLTSVETMLRGVPVVASDAGGLPEAKLGVDYVLPVNAVQEFVEEAGQWPPQPIVPEQDVRPWQETLRQLLTDCACYERIARASQEAALSYVRDISVEPLEAYLQGLQPAATTGQDGPERKQRRLPASLSDRQRALLALKLKQKQKVAMATESGERR